MFCDDRPGAGVLRSRRWFPHCRLHDTTHSWFICLTNLGKDDNGSDVHPARRLYTQSDNGAWGFTKDGDIISETNPSARATTPDISEMAPPCAEVCAAS